MSWSELVSIIFLGGEGWVGVMVTYTGYLVCEINSGVGFWGWNGSIPF
jgi:hypothetical protein